MTQVCTRFDYNTIYDDCHASFMLKGCPTFQVADASLSPEGTCRCVSGGTGMPPYFMLRVRWISRELRVGWKCGNINPYAADDVRRVFSHARLHRASAGQDKLGVMRPPRRS
jgi:hypothetical protein